MDNPAVMDAEALNTALNQALETEPDTQTDEGFDDPEAEAQPKPQPSTTDEPTTETPPDEGDDSEVAKLKDQLAAMEKRLRDKDSHIGKQRNELEQIKAKLAKINVPERPSNDEFFSDPAAAQEKMDAHKQAKKEKEQLEQTQQFLELMERNRQTVTGAVPEFEENLAEIGKVLVEDDGLDPNLVQNFLTNPYSADPVALIQMAKRTSSRIELNKLRAENEELKAQVESLKQKPGKLLSKLDQAARSGPSVTAKTGKSNKSPGASEVSAAQRAAMTNEQLLEALKEASNKE